MLLYSLKLAQSETTQRFFALFARHIVSLSGLTVCVCTMQHALDALLRLVFFLFTSSPFVSFFLVHTGCVAAALAVIWCKLCYFPVWCREMRRYDGKTN